MKKVNGILLIGLLVLLGIVTTVSAHGVTIDYRLESAVHIVAAYDTGEPMAEAQVAVFSPDDKQNPWLVGTTDENGEFSFTPDMTLMGEWDIQVRQAGHGDMIHLDLSGNTNTSNSLTVPQIVLISLSILWGCVGTALYFKRGN